LNEIEKIDIQKKNMVLINCALCEKEIEVPNKTFKFCGDVCRIQAQRNRCKRYKKNNPEKIQNYNKQYKGEHTEETRKYNREYATERRQNDENFKIRTDNRSSVSNFLTKGTKFPIIMCSQEEFIIWVSFNFKPDMTYDNYSDLWQLDHVIPTCVFDLTDKEQEKICFNWKNTRPLYKDKNQEKKYSLEDILEHEAIVEQFYELHSDLSFNNMNYGVSHLPSQVRDKLMELINH